MDNPFETIESALEFLTLFDVAVTDTLKDVRADLDKEDRTLRRADILLLAVYKLEKLEFHINRSKRMANDLRLLRRLIYNERNSARETSASAIASAQS
jgi:hypothetical protein